jgi:preprotein translocase subunit SecF
MMRLKKILLWLKHYWYFPVVLIVLTAAFVIHRKKAEMLIDILVGSMESHKREVEALEEANVKKTERIEKASLDHSKEIQEIFSDETNALENAGKEKEEREKSLQELEMEMLAEEMKKAFKKEN